VHLREKIRLDGSWAFWPDPAAALEPASLAAESSFQINVPAPWQSQAEDLRLYSGAAWYRRQFELPTDWKESRIFLRIEAADYFTEVWVNDYEVGSHEGGYLPFEFDITGAVIPGENSLTVKVDDPPAVFSEIPHGKQSWYGPLSGIWQSVWLERRAEVHIQNLLLYPDLDEQMVSIQVDLNTTPYGPLYLITKVLAPDGQVVAEDRKPAPFRGSGLKIAVPIQNPLTWSPERPHLYTLEALLEDNLGQVDQVSKHFGFRKIETRNGRLYLNGEQLYLRGALDQDYYPEKICTPPVGSFLEDQIRKAKELGLNCLRCHIKVADPSYYDAADRLGMLIWTELPNWSVLTEDSGRRGRETMQGIVDRDGHHPSIIIWTIINEDWGTDLVNNTGHRRWLKDTYRWLKSLDPSRLVVDNSACHPNFHIQSDIEDYHFYRGIPDQRHEWDEFVNAFASRSSFTYCPNGETVRTGAEPLIVSEFGNWGLPDIELLKDQHGRDPWWFETGFEWSQGVVFPQGIRSRFKTLGLGNVFGSWRGFIEATQWQQYQALKYEIESMRRRPEISGYVITELTDVHWECNGLLDMNRNQRIFHNVFAEINTDTVIIPEWERVSYWVGETAQVALYIAHGAGQTVLGARLHWQLVGPAGECWAEGWLNVPSLNPGQTVFAGTASFVVPALNVSSTARLEFDVLSVSGSKLASNHLDLVFYPRIEIGPDFPVIYTPERDLADTLMKLGYHLADKPGEAQLVVAAKVDQPLLQHLQDGGRLLMLADRLPVEAQIIPGVKLPGAKLVLRKSTPWEGNWASSFSWVDRKGAFAPLLGRPLVDHSFDRVIPERVMLGWRDWEFPALVKAGIVVGWIHQPAALIGERWYGQGKVIFNAFRLDNLALAEDPTAAHLFISLLKHTIR
jgi:hypothetical protein